MSRNPTTPLASPAPPSSHPLRSLRVRNYRLFLVGQAASQCGTWLQLVALAWLVFELTGSGTALGWVTAATFGPILVLGPWTGMVADRVDKRALLLATQSLAGLQAAVLGALVITDWITVPMLYLLALAHGLLYAVENPARHAIVAELVGPADIPAAVSLGGAVSAGGRVLGPLMAGGLIAWAGIGWCFEVNAASYAIAVVGMLLLRPAEMHAVEPAAPAPGQIVAGLRYAWDVPELRVTLLLTAVVATFGFNHQVVIPLLAERAFDGGAGTYTLLYSAMSVGAVLGALVVARRTEIDVAFLVRGALGFGAATALVAVAPTLPVAVLAGALTGAAGLLFVSGSIALLQLRSAPAMRGRVMALSAMVIVGGMPIGGPLVGWVSEQFGPRWGLGVGAIAAVVAGAAAGWPRRIPTAGASGAPVDVREDS